MITFKVLSIRNFMSFGNVPEEIDLLKYRMTLIQGINKDKEDNEPDISETSEDGEMQLSEKSSNGSGKSTITQALCYALYGESIGNKIKKTNLVNKINKKHLEVSLTFEKDGVEYVIERGRSPEYLRFLVNGNDIAQGENKDTQEEIDKVLGMSSDLFCQTCLLTASTQTFMEMNAAGQRELIEQLLGVQILSDKAEKLKEKIKDVKQVIATEEVRLATVKSANEEIIKRNELQKQDYQVKMGQFEADRNSKIAQSQSAVDVLKKVDIEKELEAHKFNQTRTGIIEENARVVNQRNTMSRQIISLNDEIKRLGDAQIALNNIDIEAEKANHQKNDDIRKKNAEITEKIQQQSQLLNDKDKQIIELEHNIKTVANECMQYTSENKRLDEGITSYKKEIERLDEDVKKIENNICPTCGNKLHDGASKLAEINQKKIDLTNSIVHNESIKNTNIGQMKVLNERIDTNQKMVDSIKDSRNKVSEDITALRATISNEFVKTFYPTMNDVFEHQNKLTGLKSTMDEKQKQVDNLNVEVAKLVEVPVPDVMATFYPTMDKALVHAETVKNLEDGIVQLKEQVNPYIELLKGCEKVELMPYDETLKKASEDDLAHLEFLVKLLTNKDSFVRKKIVEQNLAYLNQKIKNYLLSMGSLQNIVFNPDLSFDITKFGDSYDFANLSRGERTSAILALNFAFRDLYELINNSINVMFVDELIDNGLDKFSAGNVVSILKKYAETGKNVFVVSHRKDIQTQMNKVLTVVMELGFSTIQ